MHRIKWGSVGAQYVADACVLRFDGVIGGRYGCRAAQCGVHEREHGPIRRCAGAGATPALGTPAACALT